MSRLTGSRAAAGWRGAWDLPNACLPDRQNRSSIANRGAHLPGSTVSPEPVPSIARDLPPASCLEKRIKPSQTSLRSSSRPEKFADLPRPL